MQAGPSYAEAFLTVLRNVTKEDTVQYVLAVLDQLLAGTALKRAHDPRPSSSKACLVQEYVWASPDCSHLGTE